MLKLFYFAALTFLGLLLPTTMVCIFPNKLGLLVAVISEIASAYFILDESNRKG